MCVYIYTYIDINSQGTIRLTRARKGSPLIFAMHLFECVLILPTSDSLQIQGAFGIAVISSDEPNLLVGARKGSPLIVCSYS